MLIWGVDGVCGVIDTPSIARDCEGIDTEIISIGLGVITSECLTPYIKGN